MENKMIDWETMEQGLSQYDKMFCQMLFYCLKDEFRKKSVSEQKSQEINTEKQEVCHE